MDRMSEEQTAERRHKHSLARDRRRAALALQLAIPALFLALVAIVIAVVVSISVLENRTALVQSICAVVDYGETQVHSAKSHLSTTPKGLQQRSREAIRGLQGLTIKMRDTGIECPPPRFPEDLQIKPKKP
jgi:hypothetical protein